jgi:hypothetical protein
MILNRLLLGFIYLWIGFAIALIVLKVGVEALQQSTLWAGIVAAITMIWDIFDPFNIRHFIAEVIFLSPAFGAWMWLEKRRSGTRHTPMKE